MKKLLFTLILILSFQLLNGQTSYEFSTWLKNEPMDEYKIAVDFNVPKIKHKNSTAWQVTSIAIFATVTEAIGDGLYDNGDKIQGKALQAISLGSHFLYIPAMRNSNASWLWVPVIEMCWRIILFDTVHNLTRGLPIGYIGNTSYWDKGMQAFSPPTGMRLFANGVIATFVIPLSFDKL